MTPYSRVNGARNAASANGPHEGASQRAGERRAGILEGLSASQVVAAALAAATSMALSSRIGLAGSIIGAAVASVVSTVASQVYRGMLSRSADKLRELRDASAENAGASEPAGAAGAVSQSTRERIALREQHLSAREGERARVAPQAIRDAVARRRQQALKRRITEAAIVAGFVALGVTCALILALTQGEGLGSKPAGIAGTAPTTGAATSMPATRHAASPTAGTAGGAESSEAPNVAQDAQQGAGTSGNDDAHTGGSASDAGSTGGSGDAGSSSSPSDKGDAGASDGSQGSGNSGSQNSTGEDAGTGSGQAGTTSSESSSEAK